ncbi:MAG: FUSC family protein [Bacteroidales bacterium]
MTAALTARFHFLLRPSRPALTFALRTTAAALAALLAALALGLDNPHWAAMTVWLVAQPTRGMVVSKGIYRLTGTALGSMAAAVLMGTAGHSPLALSLGLAAWVAACAGASTLLRGFRAYGAVLAGYSAPLVIVVGLGQHGDIAQVALMRVAEVAVGIVVSGLMAAVFVPGSTARDLLVRTRILSRDTLRWAALVVRHGPDAEIIARQHRLLSEIAQINAQTDMAAAASRQLGQRMDQARALIAALLTLMAHVRAHAAHPADDDGELALALEGAAAALPRQSPAALARWPDIAAALEDAAECYGRLARAAALPPGDALIATDWRTARMAALRAFVGVAAAGLLWSLTGWHSGPPMLMATCIMCSVFAATDTPSRNVLMAMKGGSLAVLVSIALSLLAPHGLALVLGSLLPFMVLGGLAIANRATIIPGTDFSMLLLLLSQPGAGPLPDPAQMTGMSLGIVCGMATAALVNRVGVPASPAARLDALSAEIVHDLTVLAAAPPGKGHRWRGKAYHRILRLALKAAEVAGDAGTRLEGALAALNVGLAISRLRVLLGNPALAHDRRDGLLAVLAACRGLDRAPETVAAQARAEAARQQGAAAAALRRLADALTAQPAFFRSKRTA